MGPETDEIGPDTDEMGPDTDEMGPDTNEVGRVKFRSLLLKDGAESEFVSSNECGKDFGVGAEPPSWIEEIGIECITQFILLGPRVRKTLSS